MLNQTVIELVPRFLSVVGEEPPNQDVSSSVAIARRLYQPTFYLNISDPEEKPVLCWTRRWTFCWTPDDLPSDEHCVRTG